MVVVRAALEDLVVPVAVGVVVLDAFLVDVVVLSVIVVSTSTQIKGLDAGKTPF